MTHPKHSVIEVPPKHSVIPTGGGAFAAVAEGPPHFAFAVVCSSGVTRNPDPCIYTNHQCT